MARDKIDFAVSYGEFPSFEGISMSDIKYRIQYISALNWCAASFTNEELKGITITYLTNGDESITDLDIVPAHYFTAIGKISYIRMQGVEVTEYTHTFYNNQLKVLRQLAIKFKREKEQKDLFTPVPRSPLYDTYMVGCLLEDLIDENRLLKTSNGYDLLVKYRTRRGLLTSLHSRFRAAQDEYLKARTELKEYFETVSDEAVKYRLRCYARILEDITSVMHNKKAQRKRVQRRASVERKVSKVSYCQFDDEFKIQSIDPTSIIGAEMLLVYNKKRHRITVLIAATPAGLSIKGTTVQNFDEDKSVSKTLRKPERQVQEFRRADRARRVEVLIGQIRGKDFPASGRLNADTLLLKVVNN